MITTLVTDASYCEHTRTGAWAAWIESDRGRRLAGALIPGSSGGANSAEMWAAALGLKAGLSFGIVAAGDRVQLQTDSSYVAHRLRGDYLSHRSRARIKRGLPQPTPDIGAETASPRIVFMRFAELNHLIVDVERSSAGETIRRVDRFARKIMMRERGIRQSALWEAADGRP